GSTFLFFFFLFFRFFFFFFFVQIGLVLQVFRERGGGFGAVQTGFGANGFFEFFHYARIFVQEIARVFASLPQALPVKGIERAALFDDAKFDARVQHVAFARDAFIVQNIKFGFGEWRR